MKRICLLALLAFALSGCVVVPASQYPQAAYPLSTTHAWPEGISPGHPSPIYPAPAYGYAPPVIVGPPVRFRFSLGFWSGRGRHFHGHGQGFGGFGHWRHRGFGRPGSGGWRR